MENRMSIMEQIKALEDRIAKAIEMIKALRAENAQLRTNLSNAKIREEELESIVSSLKSGNDEVENTKLDDFAYRVNMKPHFVQLDQHQEGACEQHHFH